MIASFAASNREIFSASATAIEAERSSSTTIVRVSSERGENTTRVSANTAPIRMARVSRNDSSFFSRRSQADSWCSWASDLKNTKVLTSIRFDLRRNR